MLCQITLKIDKNESHYTTLRGKLSDLVAIGFNFDLIGSDYDASFSRPIKTKQGLINGARDASDIPCLKDATWFPTDLSHLPI